MQWRCKSSSKNIHGDITTNYVINDITEATYSNFFTIKSSWSKINTGHTIF